MRRFACFHGPVNWGVRALKMKPRKPPEPIATLKTENSDLKQRVRTYKSENAKLQKQSVALQVKYDSALSRIKALEKLKVPPEPKPSDIIDTARRIAFVLNQGGFEFVDGKVVQVRPPRGTS